MKNNAKPHNPDSIGVGKGVHPPRPPNRTGGFPAYGSPVGGFLIGTVSLFARPCEARTVRHSRSRHSASGDGGCARTRSETAYSASSARIAVVFGSSCRAPRTYLDGPA